MIDDEFKLLEYSWHFATSLQATIIVKTMPHILKSYIFLIFTLNQTNLFRLDLMPEERSKSFPDIETWGKNEGQTPIYILSKVTKT